MICGMRGSPNQADRTKTADDISGSVKPGERCKGRISAGKGIGKGDARQMLGRGAYITRVCGEIGELPLQARSPGIESAIAEIRGHAIDGNVADRAARSERGQFLLVT